MAAAARLALTAVAQSKSPSPLSNVPVVRGASVFSP
jgi:hypothetical protein